MDDVKQQEVSQAEEAPVEETTAEVSQPQEQTSVPDVVAERTVPYGRFSEVNKKYKETQRKLAELEGSQKLSQFDPNDTEAIMSHPLVQELMLKDAKRELTDYARTTLESYPNLHPVVKKAILSNARGFVNENTTDVESAKLDLLEYIENVAEEAGTQPQTPKTFPVAATNVAKSDVQATRPAEVAAILAKPVDAWTEEDEKVVEDYTKTHK